jgi:hypothetical protein
MSNKKLVLLGVIAVGMLFWAIVQSHISNRPGSASISPSYLIQGLDPADIDSIVLRTGDDEVTLKRQSTGFVVVNKDNYPAKASQINDLISKCLEIETSQFVTDNPDNYDDLEVTEEKARTIVKFIKPDSSLLTGVIIGKTKELGRGTYVRLASSNAVYEASTVPWFPSGAMSFIEQKLISVKREDIESVTVSSQSGKYVLRAKEDSQDVMLEDIPAGKKLKSTDGSGVFTALTNLSFNDVKRNSGNLSFDKKYVCRLKDSTEYTVEIATEDEEVYITCSAEFTEERPSTIRKDESEEELKAKEAKLLADDKAKEFTATHKGWIYEIPDYKAKNLTKELSDLIEDREEPKAKEQTSDPNMTVPEKTPSSEQK